VHCTTADDVFRGYHTPAGTAVLVNSWAMSFNPEHFPDPKAFKPEQWLPITEGKAARGPHSRDFALGFGRWVCPGQNWADNLIFIAAASMLAAFNIEKAIDEHGKPIAPNDPYYPSFIGTLGPSKCKFTPRSQRMVSLIESSVEGKWM